MKTKITITLLCIAIAVATILTITHAQKDIVDITESIPPTTAIPLPAPSIPECPPVESISETPPETEPSPPAPFTHFVPFESYLYQDTRLRMPLSAELQEHTYRMSLKYDVPYRVIMGLMGVEAGWQADIGTKTNGNATYVGLGMMRDIYHADKFAAQGIDIYTPKGNIEAICILIRQKLDMFDNNIHYALMAYNLGNGGAQAKIDAGIHETGYSHKVLRYANSLV